jgi:hypothetical protein
LLKPSRELTESWREGKKKAARGGQILDAIVASQWNHFIGILWNCKGFFEALIHLYFSATSRDRLCPAIDESPEEPKCQ